MRNRFVNVICCLMLAVMLSGCSSVYEAFIGEDSNTKARFAEVPKHCNNKLDRDKEISACTKDLMPLGREYGTLALARIKDYGDYALPETKKKLPEFKEKIEQNCFAQIDQADKLFAEGQNDVAVEIALGSLSDCFFRGDAVMERSYGGMTAEPLRLVTDKALKQLYGESLLEDPLEKT